MSTLFEFLIRIFKSPPVSEEGNRRMRIIIRRPFAQLEGELFSTFKGQRDTRIIVDRRYGERRTSRQPVSDERRRTDRRRPKEELVEVIITA